MSELIVRRLVANLNMKRQIRVANIHGMFNDHMSYLPDELLMHIFGMLKGEDLLSCAQVRFTEYLVCRCVSYGATYYVMKQSGQVF